MRCEPVNWAGAGKGAEAVSVSSPATPTPSPHSGTTYPDAELIELQAPTHVQETLHAGLVQDDIHRDPALAGSIHDVLEDVAIGEEVHDHSDDLDGEGHMVSEAHGDHAPTEKSKPHLHLSWLLHIPTLV